MDASVLDEQYALQIEACDSGDIERDHWDADTLLCSLLNELGCEKSVAAWAQVEKWYA